MSTQAYILRHGRTDMSPKPEWQSQIPLNELGRAQAIEGAWWLKLIAKPKPVWGVSSDLKRAEETLALAVEVLGIETVKPMPELRALDKGEDPKEFERRNKRAFDAIFKVAEKRGVALIAAHRSNTAFIGKYLSGVEQHIDYREDSLVHEGGVIELRANVAIPRMKTTSENPHENLTPQDGTPISGFVTEEDNQPPRECWNCKWRPEGQTACHHPVVKADDELGTYYGKHRNAEGYWIVSDRECCNSFQNRLSVILGGGASSHAK